jgi:hypothetical protein
MEDLVLTSLLLKYPTLGTILVCIGVARIIFKPIMMLIARYVESTISSTDNESLKKFMNSPVYMLLCFVFDLTASIKLPTIRK